MWNCESLALASAGSRGPGRPADARAERRDQPHRARVRAAGSHRARAARHLALAGLRPRASSAPRWSDVESDADGVRVVLRDVAGGASRVVRRPLPDRAPTGRTARVRDDLGIADARARRARWTPQPCCSAHRSGTWLASTPLRHLRHQPPRGQGRARCPRGRGDRWIYGVHLGAGPRATLPSSPRSEFTRLIRLATGVADLRPEIERIGAFTFAAQLAERFRARQRVPRGRRRAPGVAARRHGHEHRDPRRLRPRLEARLGAARLGTAGAARHLRASSAGRSPSTTSRARPIRTARSGRSADELRADLGRPHRAPLGADTRRPGLDARPAGPRADPLHGPAERTVGGRRRLRARPASARRPSPRCASAHGRSASVAAARCSPVPTAPPPAGGRAASTRCQRCTLPSGDRRAGALRGPAELAVA